MITENELGQHNMWAKEPTMTYTDHPWGVPHNEVAEKLNGRLAMVGIIAGFISYSLTGNFFFGVI